MWTEKRGRVICRILTGGELPRHPNSVFPGECKLKLASIKIELAKCQEANQPKK